MDEYETGDVTLTDSGFIRLYVNGKTIKGYFLCANDGTPPDVFLNRPERFMKKRPEKK